MNLEILLASGETDTLNGVDETIVEDNYLHVLMEIDGDEIPAGMKTLTVTRELSLDEESQLRAGGHQEVKKVPGYLKPHLMTEMPRPTKTQTYRLAASYAPGMWMKVMYL